jgi:hypothetical protein
MSDISIDPLSIFAMFLMQIGSRHFVIELTDAQKKLIKHPFIQSLILFAMIYISTRNIHITGIIMFLCYISVYILFNEKNKYNILSKNWLATEGLLDSINTDIKTNLISYKEIYKNNLNKIL